MALSEDEQKMLNLIAESMYQDDPQLATTLATETPETFNRKKVGLAALVFLLGLVVLVSAVPVGLLIAGPVGFSIALAGGYFFYRNSPWSPRM
jgi:hypothetical protein